MHNGRPCLGYLEKQADRMDSQEENSRASNSFGKQSLLRNLINVAQIKKKKGVNQSDILQTDTSLWWLCSEKKANNKESEEDFEYIMGSPHPTPGAKVMKCGKR